MTFGGTSPATDREYRIATGILDLDAALRMGFTCTLALEAGLQVLLEIYDPAGVLRLQLVRFQAGESSPRPASFPSEPASVFSEGASWEWRAAVRNVSSLGPDGGRSLRWSATLRPQAAEHHTDVPRDAGEEPIPISPGIAWGDGFRWHPGDLHQHTTISDGSLDPEALAWENARRGLTFLAITDHQVFGPTRRIAGRTVLGGAEVTTPHGHFLALGDLPKRGLLGRTPGATFGDCSDIARTTRRLAADGNCLVACHPVFPPWHWRCGDLSAFPFDAMEILCDPSHPRAAEATDGALDLWTRLLDAGIRMAGVGGSDFHVGGTGTPDGYSAPCRPGDPTTFLGCVFSGPEPGDLFAALRAGRSSVGRGFFPGFAVLRGNRAFLPGDVLRREPGPDEERLLLWIRLELLEAKAADRTYRCSVTASGTTLRTFETSPGKDVMMEWTPPDRDSGWVRLDIRDSGGRLCGHAGPVYLARTDGGWRRWNPCTSGC